MDKITIGSEVGMKVTCSMCQKEGTTNEFVTLRGKDDQDVYFCPVCKEKLNQEFEDATKNPNILRAVIAGSIAAIVGGVVWYFVTIFTGMEIGYISLGLGYLIGYGVYIGSGKKRGHMLQVISAMIAVIAIIIIEKFILDHFLTIYIQENLSEFPDFAVGDTASISFFAPEFWTSMLSPVGLLIYAIGIYLAYSFCKPQKI